MSKCPYCGGEINPNIEMRLGPVEGIRLAVPAIIDDLVPLKPLRISDLRPGARFRAGERTGTLLKLNSCRAVVRLDAPDKTVRFTAPDGTEREFVASGGRTQTWARNAEIDEVLK